MKTVLVGGRRAVLRADLARFLQQLHGGADTVVGVEKALALEGLLKKHGRAFEVKIYDKQEHLFGAQMVSLDALDAQRRALDFLGKYLKPEPPVAAGAR